MKPLHYIFEELGMDSHHYEQFLDQLSIKQYRKKEHLITEGVVCDFIGIVVSGTLRSYISNEDQEHNNDFYLEDDFVCAYTSYLTQVPTNCNIETLTDTEILYISKTQFTALISKDESFLKLAKYISDHNFIRKCRRETSFLKNSARERLENLYKIYPGIEQRVSQYHIASYLGIKPESLSRIKLLTYINK